MGAVQVSSKGLDRACHSIVVQGLMEVHGFFYVGL